ncbi:MAG TPA: DUF1622 domain-containing protein [Myxococcaceae bacterium]|nr:DUF1622 domain-containing protein [Myxococcaceae bacterium]
MTLKDYADLTARLFEFAGITVILLGALWAPVAVTRRRRGGDPRPAFKLIRRNLAGSILVGLELLVGADIIMTISHAPELRQVLVLGLIILIRTFLSITLDVELEGTWPWSRKKQEA